MPTPNKTKPTPNKYNLLLAKELDWTDLQGALTGFSSWRAQHPDTTIQTELQLAQNQLKFLVPGIQNSAEIYERIAGKIGPPTVWFPEMYPGGIAIGVANVAAAIFGIPTAANGMNDLTGRVNKVITYSGGGPPVLANGFSGTLKAKDVHITAPLGISGDLESIDSFDNIYIHRGTTGPLGWAGFLEFRFQNIPDGMGGQVAGFTITVHGNGGTGRVQRYSHPYDHTGPNGFREHIPEILKKFKK